MRDLSRSVIDALPRRPSDAPRSEVRRRPAAPPPTIRTRCSDGSLLDAVSAMSRKDGFGIVVPPPINAVTIPGLSWQAYRYHTPRRPPPDRSALAWADGSAAAPGRI